MSNIAKLKQPWHHAMLLKVGTPSPLTTALHVGHVVLTASSIQHARLDVGDTTELILVQQGAGWE